MSGNSAAVFGPCLAGPVDDLAGRCIVSDAFPPDITVFSQSNIGEDGVFLNGLHGIIIGIQRRAGSNAEETGFRIDGV